MASITISEKGSYVNMWKEKIKNSYVLIFCIYFITLFLDITTIAVDYSWIVSLNKIVRYCTYIYFLTRFIIILPEYKKDIDIKNIKNKSKFEKSAIVIIAILLICLVINCITERYTNLILLLLILLSAYKVDYNKIIRSTMILQISLTGLLVLCSVLGITQNFEVLRNADKVRYSLGFRYTTSLAQMVFFSELLNLYIKNFKTTYTEIFEMQLINGLIYFITDSRTEFILFEAVIILMILYNLKIIYKVKKILKKITSFFVHTFAIYPILSFIIVLLYPIGGIFNDINSLLSNRLAQTYDYFEENGITIFGEKIEFIGNGIKLDGTTADSATKNMVDSGYFQILFKYGIIFAIAFILVLNILIYILYNKKKYKELFICMIYLIFDLLNPRIINIVYCPILFLVIPNFIEYFKEKRLKNDGDKFIEEKS